MRSIEAQRRARHRWKQKQKNAKNCIRCGSPTTDFVYCDICRKKDSESKNGLRQKRRALILNHYGNRCAVCEESIPEFLTIDHKDGGGTQHRKKLGPSNILKWIIEQQFPDSIQILCWNCNCSKPRGSLSMTKRAISDRRYRLSIKQKVFDAYGGKCECCGEQNISVLTIDHINGGGQAHRNGRSSTALYRELKKKQFPPGYRVLCFNCNCTIGTYGECPHSPEI
jgi:hypothetical protein